MFGMLVVIGVVLLFFGIERLVQRPMDAIEQRQDERRRDRR